MPVNLWKVLLAKSHVIICFGMRKTGNGVLHFRTRPLSVMDGIVIVLDIQDKVASSTEHASSPGDLSRTQKVLSRQCCQ